MYSFRFFVLIWILLVGCSAQQKAVSLPMEAPDAFSGSGNQMVSERWWTVFDDTQLNALVDSALTSNFDVKTAWTRLQAARAVKDEAGSYLWPELSGTAEGSVRRDQNATSNNETVEVGVMAAYELDLWGRVRAGADAERFRADAQFADYQAAALSVSAQITQTWYQLVVARKQFALVEAQLQTNQDVLLLLENRFRIGQVQNVDLLRQKQLVASTRELLALTDARQQVLAHRLAQLLGQAPREGLAIASDDLPDLPPLPETGMPLDLVRRRPDVSSAFLHVQAADRDLAVAVRNQFPRLSLSASASSTANQVDDLFKDWAFSLTGNLLAPIFYGGRLRAEVDRSKSVKQQRVYEYAQTVLQAFREVEDALVQERLEKDRLTALEEQVAFANQAYEYLQIQYFNGAGSYLDVLTALDDMQRLRRDLLDAKLALMTYRIALYRALAGSFETPHMRAEGLLSE